MLNSQKIKLVIVDFASSIATIQQEGFLTIGKYSGYKTFCTLHEDLFSTLRNSNFSKGACPQTSFNALHTLPVYYALDTLYKTDKGFVQCSAMYA